MPEGKTVDFLVLRKDFDAGPHSIPLAKLSSCGMSRVMIHREKNWFEGQMSKD